MSYTQMNSHGAGEGLPRASLTVAIRFVHRCARVSHSHTAGPYRQALPCRDVRGRDIVVNRERGVDGRVERQRTGARSALRKGVPALRIGKG